MVNFRAARFESAVGPGVCQGMALGQRRLVAGKRVDKKTRAGPGFCVHGQLRPGLCLLPMVGACIILDGRPIHQLHVGHGRAIPGAHAAFENA